MRVFSLATGSDTAGIGAGFARAFRKSPHISLRSMAASRNYIGYPIDIPYNRTRLDRYYAAADVVMLHNTLHGHHWYDAGQGKPTILMHHGRTDPEAFRAIARSAVELGAVQIGSTLDLSVFDPDISWCPPPVDIRALRRLRAKARRSKRLRIGHAPTNRDIKGTAVFLAAMDRLAARHDVETVVIEQMSWRDCLRLKATCDVFYDQPELGYGSNAIEAWAMGIPVLAGVSDDEVRSAMLSRWGRLPFIETSVDTLERDLERVIESHDLRREYGRIGFRHVSRWHSDASVRSRLTRLLRTLSIDTLPVISR